MTFCALGTEACYERLTIHLAGLLAEHLLNLRVQVLHSVNIWCTRDAHEGRWIYLAAGS